MSVIELVIIVIYFSVAISIFILLSRFYFFSCNRDEEIKAFIAYSLLWFIFVPVTLIIIFFSFCYKCVCKFFGVIYDIANRSDKIEK